MTHRLRVLIVGSKYAAPDSRGGMAELIGRMRRIQDDRVTVRTVATYLDDRVARRLWVAVRGVAVSVVLILARRVGLVHVHLSHGGSVVRKALPLLAARLVGVPAVVHAHSYDFAGWFDTLRPITQALVRRVLPADRWFVLGEVLVEPYRTRLRLGPGVVVALPNPVTMPPPVIRTPAPDVLAVSFGRLGERKGSYDLIAALARLGPAARGHLRMIIAGDGEVAAVRAAATAAGVDDLLTVRSWVDPQERDAILNRADIFVLASYDEGLPLALLEAMAWGLAPVTTPVGAIPEVVHDGVDALLVAPGDPDALARAIERLVLDGDLRGQVAAAARERAGAYDADAWLTRLLTEWTELAARSAAGRRRAARPRAGRLPS